MWFRWAPSRPRPKPTGGGRSSRSWPIRSSAGPCRDGDVRGVGMVGRPGAHLGVPEAERLLAGPAAAIPPLTLAAGSDDFLRDRVVAAFRSGAAAERSDLRRLEGDDLSPGELAAALASISLFGDALRIWIR